MYFGYGQPQQVIPGGGSLSDVFHRHLLPHLSLEDLKNLSGVGACLSNTALLIFKQYLPSLTIFILHMLGPRGALPYLNSSSAGLTG